MDKSALLLPGKLYRYKGSYCRPVYTPAGIIAIDNLYINPGSVFMVVEATVLRKEDGLANVVALGAAFHGVVMVRLDECHVVL